jgi:hypothetical protein
MTPLDRLLPDYDVVEHHERQLAVSAAEAFAAFRGLPLRDLPVSRLLFGVRSVPDRVAGRPGLPSSRSAPILDQLIETGFAVLWEDDRSVVVGTIAPVRGLAVEGLGGVDAGMFAAYDVPGYVKVAMEWAFEDMPDGGCRAMTETRVQSTDEVARVRFGRYWRLIGPFSAFIRREWLAALARATE